MRGVWIGLATALVVGLAGCGNNDDNGGGNDPAEVDDAIDALVKWEECEVLTTSSGLVCEELEGGTEYLLADIRFSDPGAEAPPLEGYLYYVFVANTPMTNDPDWQAADPGDRCTVAWSLSGEWIDEGLEGCEDCTHTMNYTNSFSAAATDCPANLVQFARQRFDGADNATWYVRVNSDGTAVSYDTQSEWAPNGFGDEQGVVVWSDSKCQWLGVDECERE